jgi:cellulose synthase/poly-beta-1,6-N-acetylglucosamine synthase-like glycosyltransferase
MPIVSGGFGLYRRDVVIAVGGYRHGHLGEDMDMCLQVQRLMADTGRTFSVVQVPESLCWTEFPSRHDVLRRQRIRWHRGLTTVLGEHRSMIGRRRYGNVGTVGVGSLLVFEWIGPLLEAIGWVLLALLLGLGWASPAALVLSFLTTQVFGMALTAMGVSVMARHLRTYSRRSDTWRLIGWAMAVNWGYRQLTLVWRLRSFLPGSSGWGEMPRAGFRVVAPASSAG